MALSREKRKEIFGSAPWALFWNLVISGGALAASAIMGGPKIYIDPTAALAAGGIFFLGYYFLTWWSILTLSSNRFFANLSVSGPYQYVRHPMYSAIIWLLNPAIAVYFRSWLMLAVIIPIYFVWRWAAKKEDRGLREKFGFDFIEYWRSVWPLFPNLWRLNRMLFSSWSGLIIFLIIFISLNFPAEYLRWVAWDKDNQITYNEISDKKNNLLNTEALPIGQDGTASQIGLPISPNYSAESNSIIISKLNLKAPLVFASGTTQEELNAALNQGVIFYPGSALPGANGEVFLTGHSSTYPWNKTPYGRVFTLLDRLEKDDVVSLVYEHQQFDYRILSKEVLKPEQVTMSQSSAPTITLYTCWPIGTSLKRLVLRGELIL